MKLQQSALLLVACLVPLAACDCGGPDEFVASAFLQPTILDLGPVPTGETCNAFFDIVNEGGRNVQTEGAAFSDANGDYVITLTPQLIELGSTESLLFQYTADDAVGDRQTANITVQTDIGGDNSDLTGTVSALVTSEASAIAVAECEGAECTLLDFGAVQTDDAATPIDQRIGKTLSVEIINRGDAAMEVAAVLIDGGTGGFAADGLKQGDILVEAPFNVAAGRPAPCQPLNEDACLSLETCNIVTVDVKFAPSDTGAQNAELVVITNALEGAELRVPLSGLGADVGLTANPQSVRFGEVPEGGTADVGFLLSNIGTNDAPVNNTCLDIGGDGTCDGECTGGDPALDGALSCEVFTSADVHEGKGFILSATDAAAGGDDERTILVSWNPVAGNAAIPGGTVIRVETAILGNIVYEIPVLGGSVGELEAQVAPADECEGLLCVRAEGDVGDTTTWSGSVPFSVINSGDASVTINTITLDGPETVVDDFTLNTGAGAAVDLGAPNITIAPGATSSFTLEYANNDASQEDLIDLVFAHTGANGELVISAAVAAPAE